MMKKLENNVTKSVFYTNDFYTNSYNECEINDKHFFGNAKLKQFVKNVSDSNNDLKEQSDKETDVAILPVQNTTSTNNDGELCVDKTVECNYRGRGRWFKGILAEIKSDNLFVIKYDDGDIEITTRENIRLLNDSRALNGELLVGSRVVLKI